MSDKTAIQWTDATWNPVTGCSRVSDGCRFCYAEALSLRYGWSAKPWTHANAAENVVLHPERLQVPLRWRNPRMVFVNSMSDLFHERIPDTFIERVFGVMASAPQHIFQVLTKRPERMLEWMQTHTHEGCVAQTIVDDDWPKQVRANRDAIERVGAGWPWPLPNVWLGVSVENQRAAAERIPLLLRTPAAVRFLSVEPLLEAVDLREWIGCNCPRDYEGDGHNYWFPASTSAQRMFPRLHWVIVGGESGLHHRPFDADWARTLRDQCSAAGVAFFFKQHGGRTPKAGGRMLDGRTWDEMPTGKGAA